MPRPLSVTVTELSGLTVTADPAAVPGESLVDRVVDDFVDEVVKPPRAGRSDVHARPLAHRIQAFENLDILGVVVRLLHLTSQSAERRDRGAGDGPDCLRKYTRIKARRRATGISERPAKTAFLKASTALRRGGLQHSPAEARKAASIASLKRSSRTSSAAARALPRAAPLSLSRWSPVLASEASGSCGGAGGLLDHETQTLHRVPGETSIHPREDLPTQVGQLVGPYGGHAAHREHPIEEAARTRAARHGSTGGERPGAEGTGLVARPDSPQRRVEDLAERPRQAAVQRVVLGRPVHKASISGGAGPAAFPDAASGTAACCDPGSGSSTKVAPASSSFVKYSRFVVVMIA